MSAVQASDSLVLHYAGDVTPDQAWDQLAKQADAVLIDVRTQPEWTFSGLPNLRSIGKQTVTLSWKIYPTMEVNPHFVSSLSEKITNKNAALYFLCKTGGRSLDAAIAMTRAGYSQCYNVAHGFEGDRDEHGHRGTANGWKASNLPWEQA